VTHPRIARMSAAASSTCAGVIVGVMLHPTTVHDARVFIVASLVLMIVAEVAQEVTRG